MVSTTRGGISAVERQGLATVLKTDLLAAGGGAIVKLFDNDIFPTPLTKVADFHEASFTGYAPYAVANWQANYFRNDAAFKVYNTQLVGFQASTGLVPVSCYGFYIVDAATALVLYAFGRFDAPVLFAANGDTLVFDATLKFPDSTGQWRV